MATLFAPTVCVNGTVVAVKPNSFSYTEGFGERKVRVASAGGGSLTQITSEDLETRLSMCKFMLYATSDNEKLIRGWQKNREVNTVEVTDKGGFKRNFKQAIITNDPDVALGVDGEIEVEFSTNAALD